MDVLDNDPRLSATTKLSQRVHPSFGPQCVNSGTLQWDELA
jgi:hypothetical protein